MDTYIRLARGFYSSSYLDLQSGILIAFRVSCFGFLVDWSFWSLKNRIRGARKP